MTYSLYQLLWLFLLYSLLGWCAGVVASSLRKHAFINTGFLTTSFFSFWEAPCSPPF